MAPRSTLSPSAKKILQAQRRLLEKEKANNYTTRSEAVKRELSARAEAAVASRKLHETSKRTTDTFFASMRSIVSTVAASWGIRVPIDLSSGVKLEAWTDYKKIVVRYPILHSDFVSTDLTVKAEEITEAMINIKAAVYHEVGHNRFTIPLITLIEKYTEHVEHLFATGDTDGALKALKNIGIFSPSDDPYLRSQQVPKHCRTEEIHNAWNILEDQRMEAVVVKDSPIIGAYLTSLIKRHFPVNECVWLFVAGRRYLPQDFRDAARELFVSSFGYEGAEYSRALGEERAAWAERIIIKYMATTSTQEMLALAIEFDSLMSVIDRDPKAPHEHWKVQPTTPSAADSATQEDSESDSSDESTGTGSSGAKDKDGQDRGEDGQGRGEDSTTGEEQDQQSGTPNKGVGKGSKTVTERDLKNMLNDIVQDAVEALKEDSNVQSEAQAVLDNIIRQLADPLPKFSGDAHGSSALWESEAVRIAAEMERSFDIRIADCAPMWQTRTTRGIVDPFAYRTREPGSREFYRLYDDSGDLGRSLAVSVLLDTSGSMSGQESNLSISGYAIASACRALDIPVNVMAFDSYSQMLYSANDAEICFQTLACSGGTEPDEALRACLDQDYDKRQHLVFILTDGLWFAHSLQVLQELASDNRKIFLLGWNLGRGNDNLRTFANHGAAEVQPLRSLSDLPLFVQNAVAEHLG